MDIKAKYAIKRCRKDLKRIDLNNIRPFIEDCKIFTKLMLDDVYDPTNDSEFFYDLLCTRGPYAFSNFINILSESGYTVEANILQTAVSEDTAALFYKMKSNPIGLCRIIINENFDNNPKPRLGSDIDAQALLGLFNRLGFNVSIKWNLSAAEMIKCLREFSNHPDFSQVDSSIVFIATHGDRINNCDVLTGTDNKPVYIADIYTMFDNNHCKNLRRKPKMFFFQACRGLKEDAGVYEIPKESSDASEIWPVVIDRYKKIVCHPTMTDMIVVHSTLPDHKSRRDHDQGSWLFQDIVNIFSIDYLRHDLLTMLLSVCARMEERISEEQTKQTIHVELFGVTKIVKFDQR